MAGLEPPPISWLAQLTVLPQLTKVELDCGEVTPDDFLMQLPAGRELIINTTSLTLEESRPHHVSLAHLVTLNVEQCCCHPYTLVEFSCLASCPNLRYVRQSVDEMHRRFDPTDPDWVDLALGFRQRADLFQNWQQKHEYPSLFGECSHDILKLINRLRQQHNNAEQLNISKGRKVPMFTSHIVVRQQCQSGCAVIFENSNLY